MGPVALRHVLALIPLVVSVVLANQRAILVNLGVVILVVCIAAAAGHWQGPLRRFHVGAGQVVLAVLAVVAVTIAVVVVPAAVDKKPAQIPLASTYQSLFHNQGKAESAQDRLNLAAEAEKLIPQHLLVGWGLGIEFPYYEAGSRTVITIAYAHNLLLDLWLRLGIIGVVSFFLALLGSVAGGLRVWRRHRDPVTAALALALVGVVVGLVATGSWSRCSTNIGLPSCSASASASCVHASLRWTSGPGHSPGAQRPRAQACRPGARGGPSRGGPG